MGHGLFTNPYSKALLDYKSLKVRDSILSSCVSFKIQGQKKQKILSSINTPEYLIHENSSLPLNSTPVFICDKPCKELISTCLAVYSSVSYLPDYMVRSSKTDQFTVILTMPHSALHKIRSFDSLLFVQLFNIY